MVFFYLGFAVYIVFFSPETEMVSVKQKNILGVVLTAYSFYRFYRWYAQKP